MTLKNTFISGFLLFCMVFISACSDDSSGITSVQNANTSDFVGTYNVTDPERTYEEYHSTVTFLSDMTCNIVDVFYNSLTLRGTGKWSFSKNTLTFWISSEDGGEFSGPIVGNVNDFTLDGHWSNGKAGAARFVRD